MIINVPKSAFAAAVPQTSPDLLQLELRNEAWQLSGEGKWAAAVRIWKQILENRHDDGDAASELGLAYLELKKPFEAIEAFERALQFKADRKTSRLKLGSALNWVGRHAEARTLFEHVLGTSQDNVEALVGLSRAWRGLGKLEASLSTAERALNAAPRDPDALVAKGEALRELKRTDEAIVSLLEAGRIAPGHRRAAIAVAGPLRDAYRGHEAAQRLQQVAALHPDDTDVLAELGNSLLSVREYAQAAETFRQLLDLQPASAAHLCNYSIALSGLDRFDESVAACRQALAIDANSSTARFNMAFVQLALANFDEGWDNYEYRLHSGHGARSDLRAAPWCGEDLRGKSIMVLGEQGNGDHLQFIRYLAPLVEMGADVSFLGPKRLLRILSSEGLPVTFVHELEPEMRFDHQVYLLSLPHRFHKLGRPVPPAAPYLKAEPAYVERWRQRLGSDGLRVGIVWQGAVYAGRQSDRAFRLEHLRPLAGIPGVRLISLQIGKGTEQLEALNNGVQIETLGPDFDTGEDGFLDAAGVMANLDLVISCDTSLAHLAGALGRPLWIALNDAPEWRWQRHREDTPWYATARLFRQEARGDWEGVFVRMAESLRQLAASGPKA